MNVETKKKIKFGTDGWRAVIGKDYTFENLSVVAQATAEWINREAQPVNGRPKEIVIGYDTRFMSGDFAELVARVIAANNIKVKLSPEPIPTPALSYGVPMNKCVCGIMITASHNPYQFNGYKIKTREGGGAGKDITGRVEEHMHQSEVKMVDFDEARKAGLIGMYDFKKPYLKFLRSYLDLKKMKMAKFKVLTDAMHGSGNSLMAEVIKGTKVNLTLMREDINPYFDGKKPEPVVEFLDGILSRMKKEKFDLGLVLDGDADRIAAVAPGGEYIHPQKILGLLVLHLVRNRGRKGGIVKTICGTTMMDNIAKKLGCKLYETPVGFKWISDLMVTERIVAGGEEAGGMGVQDYIPERDGTLAGLLLLEMMVYQKKNIKKIVDEMEKEFGRYYYQRADVKLKENAKPFDLNAFKQTQELLGRKVVNMKDFDGVKLTCDDESWLMLRPSGTEPLVRAYSESKSLKRAKDLIKFGEELLRKGT